MMNQQNQDENCFLFFLLTFFPVEVTAHWCKANNYKNFSQEGFQRNSLEPKHFFMTLKLGVQVVDFLFNWGFQSFNFCLAFESSQNASKSCKINFKQETCFFSLWSHDKPHVDCREGNWTKSKKHFYFFLVSSVTLPLYHVLEVLQTFEGKWDMSVKQAP